MTELDALPDMPVPPVPPVPPPHRSGTGDSLMRRVRRERQVTVGTLTILREA
jgi:hypothetical protein